MTSCGQEAADGGQKGPAGPEGPAGEVTTQQLADAVATTARNPSGIAPLELVISNPPTQAEVQAIVAWLAPFLTALQR